MSGHWTCLVLLYVLQHGASADEGVKLSCNSPVKVSFGQRVTLNCSINWTLPEQKCEGKKFTWIHKLNNTHDMIPCDRDPAEYSCEWDRLTYVSLTITSAKKEENYSVEIWSNCGMDQSPSITVQVHAVELPPIEQSSGNRTQPHKTAVTLSVVCTAVAATVAVVLVCLFKKYRKKRSPGPAGTFRS